MESIPMLNIRSMLEGEHKPFSPDGRGKAKPKGGYAALSLYLLTHPLLSATDRLVLSYLSYTTPHVEAREPGPWLTTATLQDLRMDLHISRSTVTRTINYLVDLGLIIRDSQNGQKDVKLWTVPGPWPLLGDTPEHQWRDLTNHPLKAAQRWLELASKEGATVATMEKLLKESAGDLGLGSVRGW